MDSRDNQYGEHEESEYHFSDDQDNYNFDADATPAKATTEKTTKQVLLDLFNRHRRAIISLVVFFVLIFIVYKLLMPVAETPSTEFTQIAKPVQPPKTVVQQPQAIPTPKAAVVIQPPQPAVVVQQTTPAPAPVVAAAPPAPQVLPPPVPVHTAPETAAVPARETIEKLAAVEQQSTKLVDLVQTQYSQKIAEYENQNRMLQEKLQAVTKRLANMEASLNKMAQLLQEQPQGRPASSLFPVGRPEEQAQPPRVIYAVQAIIPGRAWLKSEAGDTVTVAEGDTLKGYGRVVKIDPYDGVVEIDIGNKILALSYGSAGE